MLTLAVFAVPSVSGGTVVTGADSSTLVREVLSRPLSETLVPALLLPAKLLLLAVAVVAVAGVRHTPRIVLTYYGVVLVVVALLQNAADLGSRGVAFLTGNAVAQLAVAAICLVAIGRAGGPAGSLRRGRLWAVPLMALAWAYPYAVVAGVVQPSASVLNGAGLTYCMITPVVAGVMMLRPEGFPRTAVVAVAGLGVVFGLLNMVTWFLVAPESRWMGVLHVPLLVISAALALVAWRARGAAQPALRRA